MRNRAIPLELLCWIGALVLLYFSDPHAHHFSLCPLASAGIEWCPGCGLGRSVALAMHGRIEASIQQHWLGIPALVVLVYRIIGLINNTYRHWKLIQQHEQP